MGSFLERRQKQLAEWERNQRIAEKVAENILRAPLFTEVLDWGRRQVFLDVGG